MPSLLDDLVEEGLVMLSCMALKMPLGLAAKREEAETLKHLLVTSYFGSPTTPT